MRLLYLTRTYSVHDARWLRVLGAHVADMGFLALHPTDSAAVARAHPGVECLPMPVLATPTTTAALQALEPAVAAAIDAWAPDVIFAGPVTDAGYLAARLQPGRTLLVSWAFDLLHEPQTIPGARERAVEALARGRHLFADCAAVLSLATELGGHGFESSCLLPWGLAPEDCAPPRGGWRTRLGDDAARVVIYARGFEPVHQPDRVLTAFAEAHADDRTLRLWLAGGGTLEVSMRVLAERLGLAGAVRFLGRLDQADLAGCHAEADAAAACSRSDGSSIALLQAMRAGLPCIAADLPGNREWLAPDGGWLVPVDSSSALAQAIRAATHLPHGARERIAARNRAKVRACADLATNLPRLLATLEAIASGGEAIRASIQDFSSNLTASHVRL